MTGKPSLTIEQLFTRYERYDSVRRHERHIPHPSKAGFIKGFGIEAGLGLSKQSLYNYLESANLPFPLLPEDENVLVLLLFAQVPYDITWANLAVVRAAGEPLETLVGMRPLRLLRENTPFGDESAAALRRLKDELRRNVVTIEDIWFNVADGMRQIMHIEVRYTGAATDRYYVTATPVAAPYMPEQADGEPFNVYPDLIVQMKRLPIGSRYRLIREQNEARVLSAYRALQGQAEGRGATSGRVTVSLSRETDDDTLHTLLARLNSDPELLREYMNKYLPRYQPPDLESGQT